MASKKYSKAIFVYLLFLVLYFWMAAQIPYTHDDWDWGLDIGMEQFLCATLNSRYAGNFFEIVMTRSVILKVIIMGSAFFLIPYLISSIAVKILAYTTSGKPSFMLCFIVSNCFMLTVNRMVWRQTYGWVAGFANFGISSVFLLFWIWEVFRAVYGEENALSDTYPIKISYFIICFLGQLFLENVTIFCFFLSVVICVVCYTKYRRIPGRVIVMAFGACVGLVVMFSSNMYDALLSDGTAIEGYREITLLNSGGIVELIYKLVRTVFILAGRLYTSNVPLTIVILLLFFENVRKTQDSGVVRKNRVFLVVDLLLIPVLLICGIYDVLTHDHLPLIYCFDFVVSFVCFVAISAQIILLFKGSIRHIFIFLWISGPLLLAPLAITTEVGHRLFLSSNIIFILFANILLENTMEHFSEAKRKAIKWGAICAIALLLCNYCIIYTNIGICNRTRENIIRTSVQSDEHMIILPSYPYSDYLQYPNPISDERVVYFKQFYGIPEDMKVIFE